MNKEKKYRGQMVKLILSESSTGKTDILGL
jgi:hypothetical protein